MSGGHKGEERQTCYTLLAIFLQNKGNDGRIPIYLSVGNIYPLCFSRFICWSMVRDCLFSIDLEKKKTHLQF